MAGANPSEETIGQKLDRELAAHLETVLEKNKDYKYTEGLTEENWEEEIRGIPLMSRGQPTAEDIEKSVELQALQALKYEVEDPHECALAHKDDGNHNFGKKDYKTAIVAYNEAIKQKHDDATLYAVIYTNRAAANFHLGNNRSAFNDAVSALKHKPDHMKAFIRCALSLFDLEKYDDCVSWCDRGLRVDEKEKKLLDLKKKSLHQQKQQERDRRKAEMKEVKHLKKLNGLIDVIEARIVNIDRSSKGDSKRASIEKLLLDKSLLHSQKIYLDENNVMHWPLYFLYPEYNQSDFIEDFCEDNCFQDHLDVIFETLPEWDVGEKYNVQNLAVYFEDKTNEKLVRLNHNLTLRMVLSDDRYTICGNCPAFMVFSKKSDYFRKTKALQEADEF